MTDNAAKRLMLVTADEFAELYARRSGMTAERLREFGREPRPCDCPDVDGPHWQMAHIKEARWAAEHDCATEEELSWLA